MMQNPTYILGAIILGVLLNMMITGSRELESSSKIIIYVEIVILIIIISKKINSISMVVGAQ